MCEAIVKLLDLVHGSCALLFVQAYWVQGRPTMLIGCLLLVCGCFIQCVCVGREGAVRVWALVAVEGVGPEFCTALCAAVWCILLPCL